MTRDQSTENTPERKLLIIKAGTLAVRAPDMVEKFGDQDGMFVNTGAFPPEHIAVTAVFDGEEITAPPEDYAGVLITGSAAMVSAPTPWMEATAAWLRRAVDADLPVLGVCFGHQMVAYALGGRVGENPRGPEAGTISVDFDPACADDPLFAGMPARASFNAHHYETVLDLPQGANVLACNATDDCQAVRYGPNAWGVQFHPEITGAIMRDLMGVVGDALAANGVDTVAMTDAIQETPYGPVLLQRFFEMAVGASARAECAEQA